MIQHIDRSEVLDYFGNRCALCGDKFRQGQKVEMHHTAVYRSDIGRKAQNDPERGSINESVNILPVHGDPCHRTLQSNRQLGMFLAIQNYGEQPVKQYVMRMLPKTWRAKWNW